MKIIRSFNDITPLICDFINRIKLTKYLIYGSYAYEFYTHNEDDIHDVDIIVERSELMRIETFLRNVPEFYSVYSFDGGLHVNLKKYEGVDGKPFDISLDAMDRLINPETIDLTIFTEATEGNTLLHIIPKNVLRERYTLAAQKFPEKAEKYTIKAKALQ